MGFHKNLREKDLHSPSKELVVNSSGGTINKLKVVQFTGIDTTTGYPTIEVITDLSDKARGVVDADIENNSSGVITGFGFLSGADTSSFTLGQVLYSDASGNLTTTPTDINVGKVLKVDATDGVIFVRITIAADVGSATPTGPAGGDLSGTYPNPSVNNDSHSHTASTITLAHADLTGIGANDHHPQLHAAQHITGGGDVIDGDRADITFVPSEYTRDSSPSEAGNVLHLTAHLKGIGNALAKKSIDSHVESSLDASGDTFRKTNSGTYTSIAQFIYRGSNNVSTPTRFSVIGSSNGASTSSYRLFDITNSLTIAELASQSTNTTPAIFTTTTITNIPTGNAIFELQLRKDGANEARVHYFKIGN